LEQKKAYRKGWRNNYRSTMPITEVVAKDVKYALQDAMRWLKHFKQSTIVAYPDFPSKKTTLHKIAQLLNSRLTNKTIAHPKVVIYFEDATHGSSAELRNKYPNAFIVNELCTDISKKKVDAVHAEVFGYNTFINPLTYHGKAVQKSDTNALHDGAIVECPLAETQSESIYQVLIDNTYDSEFVLDYRVALVGNAIVNVYKKYKKYEVRFTNEVSYSELCDTATAFTEEEQQLIISFTKKMVVDFCELDVLRNKTDNKIYIIDVNKTPYGPPFGLPAIQAEQAVAALAEQFRASFLS
jgi:RimK-like ATP-grasp domain